MLTQALRQGHAQVVIPATGQLLATQKAQQPEHAATHKAITHHVAIPEQHITAAAKAHKQLQAAQAAVIPFRQQAVRRAATPHHQAVQAVREAVRITKAPHRALQAVAATSLATAHHRGTVAAAIQLHREAAQVTAHQVAVTHVAATLAEATQVRTVREAAHRVAVAHHRHHHRRRVADVNSC